MLTPADLKTVPAIFERKLPPYHPGHLLAEEVAFRGLNANSLATKLHIPANRIRAIMQGKRTISPDTAIRLERFLGIPAKFWLRLQSTYDLDTAEHNFNDDIALQMAAE